MKFISSLALCLFFCTASQSIWAQEAEPFRFLFQGVYSDKVTVNRVEQLFHDFSSSINHPVVFNSGISIEYIEEAIEKKNIDLLLWGDSKELNKMMQKNGFTRVTSSHITVNVYQYIDAQNHPDEALRVATLNDSGALYLAKDYFSDREAIFTTYENYFSIIEACFRKEVDIVIAAKIFITPQPDTIEKRFTLINTLPQNAKISVWLKTPSIKANPITIAQYFSEKQKIFKKILGTQSFKSEF